ncbi:MAG: hypothetical protein QXI59_00625 [Candidatus Bathyarchaeia archaeon]
MGHCGGSTHPPVTVIVKVRDPSAIRKLVLAVSVYVYVGYSLSWLKETGDLLGSSEMLSVTGCAGPVKERHLDSIRFGSPKCD